MVRWKKKNPSCPLLGAGGPNSLQWDGIWGFFWGPKGFAFIPHVGCVSAAEEEPIHLPLQRIWDTSTSFGSVGLFG